MIIGIWYRIQSECSRKYLTGSNVVNPCVLAYNNSRELFRGLKIMEDSGFESNLNQYDVIALNMQEFLSRTHAVKAMLERLSRLVVRDLMRTYPDVDYFEPEDLIQSMQDVYEDTGHPFVMIIDEWDCALREYKQDQ